METRLAKRKKLENQIGGSSGCIEAHRISAVFGNDIIFRRIVDHLGTPDLKILRQTSHLLLAKVNGYLKFIQNMKVTILEEAVEENVLSQHRTIQWKGVKILTNKTGDRHFSRIPANSLVHLELRHETKKGEEDGTSSTPQELRRSAQGARACFKFLKKSEFTDLESLTIDQDLFKYDIPAGALNEIVRRLKSFRLAKNCGEFAEGWSERECENFEENMGIIESFPWRLQLLSSDVEYICSSTGSALGAILASSVNTVEEIKLGRNDFNDVPQIHGLRFPRLKNLNMSLRYDSVIPFSAFFNLQPELESLQLSVEEKISPACLDAIKAKCSSSKLHTFELEGESMFTCFPAIPALDSWQFLQGMTGLKRFSIQNTYGDANPENITAILSYLPSTIEGIRIRSHDSPKRSISISALTGFPHLTYLNAQDCGILKIDDALQSICRTLTKLRVFKFGEYSGSSITDMGITGESSLSTIPDSGISLNNLKGLQKLGLYGCCETTEQGLVKAVRFLELRVLETNRVITDPVLLEIAKNNPSLESVTRHVEGSPPHVVKDGGFVFRNLLAVNPRLTRIKSFYEASSICSCCRGKGKGRVVKCEESHRPSYGVPSRLSDKSIMRRALSTMKIGIGGTDSFIPAVTYSCNLSEQ